MTDPFPQLGAKPTAADKAKYSKASNYRNGRFHNLIPTSMDMGFIEGTKVMWQFMTAKNHRRPADPLPVQKINRDALAKNRKEKRPKITWFGHSTLLLEMHGKIIMIDPMMSRSPSPFTGIGTKRFSNELPINVHDLPPLDAVFISHDHYDHLDHNTIQQIKDKTGRYFVPLGVKPHLVKWGVAPEKIYELNWWEDIQYDDIKLICAPARHFSGRGLLDRNSTLWCSWIIQGEQENIYFNADSGYGPHFKDIGEKYGPFDLALMECGQYNWRWEAIHMLPEQTVQAFKDVKGKILMPVHWGAFTLSLHSWTDPVEQLSAMAEDQQIKLATPMIGEQFLLNNGNEFPQEKWWRKYT